MEEENPIMTMVRTHQFRDPAIAQLAKGGLATLRANVQRLLTKLEEETYGPQMMQLKSLVEQHGPAPLQTVQLDTSYFKDLDKAGEISIALVRWSFMSQEAVAHLMSDSPLEGVSVDWLLQERYFRKQREALAWRFAGFGVLVGALSIAPWLLHKIATARR